MKFYFCNPALVMLQTLGTPNSSLGVSHEVNLPRVWSWEVVMIQPVWGPTSLGGPRRLTCLDCLGIWPREFSLSTEASLEAQVRWSFLRAGPLSNYHELQAPS